MPVEDSQKTKLPITTEVYNDIKDKIIHLDLMPGQILMVQQLSKSMGISRTPVREAIIHLRDDGLVEEADGRKFRITNITWKMINDIYETRQALEGIAASELAKQITQDQVAELRGMITQMEALLLTNDSVSYFEKDSKFHSTILAMHNNKVMISCLERIQDQQQRIRFLTMGVRSRLEGSISEHTEIVNCLAQKDAQGAAAQVKRHLDMAKEDIKSLLQAQFPRSLIKG